ncbi:MAG: hypothetical protein O2960_24330 [Verrucomicrobia bacterium]|nr:hypothetical protein [Verrucomicrobiota bacterium]
MNTPTHSRCDSLRIARLVFAAAALLFSATASGAADTSKRPNILFIFSDVQSY